MKNLAPGRLRLGRAAAHCVGMVCNNALSHVSLAWKWIALRCLHDRQIKKPAWVKTAPGKLVTGGLARLKPAARDMDWVTVSVTSSAPSCLRVVVLAPPQVKLNHAVSRTVLNVLVDGCLAAGQVVMMCVAGALNINKSTASPDLAWAADVKASSHKLRVRVTALVVAVGPQGLGLLAVPSVAVGFSIDK